MRPPHAISTCATSRSSSASSRSATGIASSTWGVVSASPSRQYAATRKVDAYGIDYSGNMIDGAKRRLAEAAPDLQIDFREASVVDLPFDGDMFDVVTSHRCLMALLDWDLQKEALVEIHRVLKPGGMLVLMEGTFEGLARLNFFRSQFGLGEIDAGGRDRLLTLKFRER